MISTIKMTGLLAVIAIGITATGCSQDDKKDEAFFPDHHGEQLEKAMQTQMSIGARNDAMLRQAHFDGATLNSLGQQRLDSSLYLTREGKQYLYVNLDEKDELTEARLQAVADFYTDRGVDADAVVVALGTNPKAYHIASLTSFYQVKDNLLQENSEKNVLLPTVED